MGKSAETGTIFKLRISRLWAPAALFVIIVFVAAVRYRLRDMPLERDEGEYAYGGQLILDGIPPYALAYFMKFPGVHFAYAILMSLFGQTTAGIHLGFLAVNAATILLVYLLGKRLIGRGAGVAAAAVYAIMSLSPAVLGFAAHATHFVVFCALGGILLLLRAIDSGRLAECFLSGVLLGISILMKQPGAFFLLFGLVVVMCTEATRRPFQLPALLTKTIAFIIGGGLPLVVTCLLLWWAGVFRQFWFCTVTLVRTYATTNSFGEGRRLLYGYIHLLLGYDAVFWILGGLAMIVLLFDGKAGRARPFIIGLVLFSGIAASQGLYFRPHYFVMMLPGLALAIGAGLNLVYRLMGSWLKLNWGLPAAALAVLLAGAVWAHREMFFQIAPDEACRKTYAGHPFCESVVMANYIREHTAPGCRVAVLGSEPQIYFYAHRLSATGYIYTFEMMGANPLATTLQNDMIQQIESTKPEIMVVVKCFFSWGNRDGSNNLIFNWADDYWDKHYDVEGVADFPYSEPSKYYWGADAAHHAKGQSQCLYLLRRKPETVQAAAQP
ncbi:MAG TPA: glycosyltransferase family 39 protein [Verrucomicrobiae bacterium]|nr:glycosyltransferase family 39 protein [Verrucomicrobiae bacterium]